MSKDLGGLAGSSSLRSPEPVPVSAHSGDDPGRVKCRKPRVGSKRDRLLSVWVSEADMQKIDAAARRNGISRAAFVAGCVGPGYRTLKEEGRLK